MPKLKLTKSAVDSLPLKQTGQTIYWDTQMPGFGLVVGRTAKTYVAQRQIGPKTARVTIGRHGIFTPDEARASARQHLAKMASGINPNQKRRERRSQIVTLDDAFKEYFRSRTTLRPDTKATYQRVLNIYLSDWKTRCLDEISAEAVATRHRRIGAKNGKATANNTMRILRAVYNFASIVWEGLPANPVMRLTLTRAWYREQRKQTVIQPHQLAAWFKTVANFQSRDATDYLLLLLFTGMRKSEALCLLWKDVDLQARTLLVPVTKNDEPLMLPLSDFLVDLLKKRRADTKTTDFVFPGEGKSGHLVEPKKFVAQVRKISGVDFTLHDLRRTFVTIAESLDISGYTVKRLVNHKDRRDVTAGYIVLSVERLRHPMQMVTDRILFLASDRGDTVQELPIQIDSTAGRN